MKKLSRVAPEQVARALGLRRTKRCWRGRCPKCGGADALAVSLEAGQSGFVHAYCGGCKEATAVDLKHTMETTTHD